MNPTLNQYSKNVTSKKHQNGEQPRIRMEMFKRMYYKIVTSFSITINKPVAPNISPSGKTQNYLSRSASARAGFGGSLP